MAKKLILLLLIIPIIVMISLFAATKTISIIVDVPVSGISISDAGSHIYLNMDNNDTHSLEYTVYPTNAKNKDISATAEPVSGKDTAKLDLVVEDGMVKIIPKSVGSARVYLTTAEGGYRASVTVHVESENARRLQSIDSTVSTSELEVGESAVITTALTPADPINPILHYSSDNPHVATVNDKGIITALRGGEATITVKADCDSSILDTVKITVKSNAEATIIKPSDFSELAATGTFSLDIPLPIKPEDLGNVKLLAYSVNSDGSVTDLSDSISLRLEAVTNGAETYYTIHYEITDPSFSGKYRISASYSDGYNSFEAVLDEDCEKLSKDDVDLSVYFDNGSETSTTPGSSSGRGFSFTPGSYEDYDWTVENLNTGVLSLVKIVGSRVTFKSVGAGVGSIRLTATLKEDRSIFAEAVLTVYSAPTGFSITSSYLENASSTVEGIFTLGKYEYTEQSAQSQLITLTEATPNKLKLDTVFSTAYSADPSFMANLSWELTGDDAEKCITVSPDGGVLFTDETDSLNLEVEISAIFGGKTLSTVVIRCVSYGINVYSYLDLYRATTTTDPNGNYRSVVLRSSIKDDFGIGVDKPYKEIATTYDTQYYENVYGKDTDAFRENSKIKILVEFRADVYGNGHEINAHNLAYGLDDYGALKSDALFRGPLNFVAMSETNSALSVSVKGQDNVCFAVYENTKINNVVLRGCSPEEAGGLDLASLDYTGTVVEIFGTNTSIEYSRIKYGRTVLRAFGDVNDPEKKLEISIKNTVLSEAREFIVRVGSNRFADGTYENYSPSLAGASEDTHTNKGSYNAQNFDRSAYDDAFINTFVTFENSVFRNTGLFAIGIDSHFASHALADGNRFVYGGDLISAAAALFKTENGKSLIDTWLGLSKTSYGAKVKFVGEVNLYTWKPIDDVDSSTLIETPAGALGETNFGKLVGKLNFNVKNMLISYNSSLVGSNRTSLIHNVGGTDHVHGGIVFFGGGKNYGVFDTTSASGASKDIPIFKVSFSDAGTEYAYLAYAAGNEPFYVAMFNASSYAPNGDDSVIYE